MITALLLQVAMEQRQNMEICNSQQPFFKPPSANSHCQSQNSFFMIPGRNEQSTPASAASFFKDTSTDSLESMSNGTLELTSSASFRSQPLQTSSQYSTDILKETVNQLDLQSSLAQQENVIFEIQNEDKMNTLHSRLHQEADKIRRWKVQTEIDIKQKERSLGDAVQTIESQRKSLLELQLQNENLSVRLQEEIDNRIDISQKIVSTRDMCNLVKDYAGKLEGKLLESEQVRDTLQDVSQKQLEDMQVLENKFKELSLLHSNKINELKSDLEEKMVQFTENEQAMSTKISGLQQECKNLEEKCEKKDHDNTELRDDIKTASRQLALLQQEKECLQESLNEANEEVEANQQLLTKIRTELKETTGLQSQLQTQQDGMEKELYMLKKEAAVAVKQRTDDKIVIQQLEEQIQAVESTLAKRKEEINGMDEEKKKLIDEQEKQSKLLEKRETEVGALKDELKEVLEREKVSYDKLDSMRKDLLSESSENSKLVEIMKCIRKEKHGLEQDLLEAKKKTELLTAKIKLLEDEVKSEKTKLQTVLDSKERLEKENQNLQTSHHTHAAEIERLLKEDQDRIKLTDDKLEQANRKITALEEKNKSAQGQSAYKCKQIKELQQEVKTLKSQLTIQTNQKKSLEEKIEKLEKHLESGEADKESLEKETADLRQQMKEAERKKSTDIKMHEEKMKQFDVVMDTYKAEYDKIVMEKDRSIDDLKNKLLQEVSSKNGKEEMSKVLEDKVSELQKALMATSSTKETLEKDICKQSEEIKSLQLQVAEKTDEIINLREEFSKKAAEQTAVKERSNLRWDEAGKSGKQKGLKDSGTGRDPSPKPMDIQIHNPSTTFLGT